MEEIPTQTELVQYEKRFVELYQQVQYKHTETKLLYAKFNALPEQHEYSQKELKQISSVQTQFKVL